MLGALALRATVLAEFAGYAPRCAIQTVDLAVSGTAVPRYSFECEPLSVVRLTGSLIKSDRINAREVSVEVKYVAGWAARFFGSAMI